jgi:hypothetical protein
VHKWRESKGATVEGTKRRNLNNCEVIKKMEEETGSVGLIFQKLNAKIVR